MRINRFTTVRRSAKALGVLGVALLTMTGCALLGTVQPGDSPAVIVPTATQDASAAMPPSSPFPDMTPRMITPATGGPPVLGIPVAPGSNIFLPATGGPPVIGIPLFP
jgi:hypothetical protein